MAYRCFRAALSDAERLGLVPANPARRAGPALRSQRKRGGFTLAEAQAIMAAAEGEALAPLFGVLLHTGLRLGEALGLRWADVDLEARRITERHNRVLVGSRMVEESPKREKSARTTALLAGAVEALQRQRTLQATARLAAGGGRGRTRIASSPRAWAHHGPRKHLRAGRAPTTLVNVLETN